MGGSITLPYLEQIGCKGVVCQQFDHDCRRRTDDGTPTLFESRMHACAMNDFRCLLKSGGFWCKLPGLPGHFCKGFPKENRRKCCRT